VKTEHLRLLWWEFLLNVFTVSFTVESLRVRRLETRCKCELHLQKNLRSDEHNKVRAVGSAIPVVSNVTTIHDITVDVSQIGIWHLFVLGQVVVEHITANGQVTIIEVVVTGPALGTELLATDNKRVEHAESEEEGLELW